MSADPVSLALIGLNAASSIAGAKAQQKTANQQAAFAEQEAERQRQMAEINRRRIEKENRKVRSRAIAQQTAGGVDSGSGSALLVQKNLAAEDSLEQSMAIFSGETQAQSLEQQARLTRSDAANKKSAAIFDVGTSLLSELKGKSKFNFKDGTLEIF